MRARESAAICLLVLSSFAATNVAPTKPELEAMYSAAAEDVTNGKYREALKKIDAIDERQPDLAAAQNLRGVALMRLQEYRNAETALRKARSLDPGFWEARFNLAEVPFLAGNWTEARNRFQELADQPNEHMNGATLDLIQFKIFLTCLLEGKEKLAASLLEKLQGSPESPALYYAKAALALKDKHRAEAKSLMATAEKEYSAQLNTIFAESFYEIGWLPKGKDSVPVALEVSSPAERIARAQADLTRAQRAFRQGDLEGAWQLLDKVDAIAPNQAVTYNLRGEILLEQGKIDEAETALRNALAADPQLLIARYNLARVPFARKEFATARKELEALLGAFSGDKEERQAQLIRYQIFLTLLLEGHEGAAQKAMDEFKMMDSSPALYYAQAAWAFQHGNSKQGKNWVANAGNLYGAELNRAFAAPFADLGWLQNPAAATSAGPEPVLVRNVPTQSEPVPEPTATPGEIIAEAAPTEAEFERKMAQFEAIPEPEPDFELEPESSSGAEPESSPSPATVARVEKPESSSESQPRRSARKRPPRQESDGEQATATRTRRTASSQPLVQPNAPPAIPSGTPYRENLGDKVRNFFLYPFQHPRVTPTPAPAAVAARPAVRASPTPVPRRRPGN